MKILAAILLTLGIVINAQSRVIIVPSFQKLFDESDLVVIAKPNSTQETAEQSILPNISPDNHVVGLSTKFEIKVVMKGDKNLKVLTLHHYKLAPLPTNTFIENGPSLIEFGDKSANCFILFLKHEVDGRYAPTAGQTNLKGISVQKLECEPFMK